MEGLAAHIKALNLAIKDALTKDDQREYSTLLRKWLGAYLEMEPLKRVCVSVYFIFVELTCEQKPKLDSATRVPEYFSFLGSLLDYNTSIYEAQISPSKKISQRNSNHKTMEMAKSIAKKVWGKGGFSLCITTLLFDIHSFQEMQQKILADKVEKELKGTFINEIIFLH